MWLIRAEKGMSFLYETPVVSKNIDVIREVLVLLELLIFIDGAVIVVEQRITVKLETKVRIFTPTVLLLPIRLLTHRGTARCMSPLPLVFFTIILPSQTCQMHPHIPFHSLWIFLIIFPNRLSPLSSNDFYGFHLITGD